MDHRKAGREKMIPEVHVDYCFMGSKGDATTRCIVVGKEYESKSVMASVVPVKGSSNEFPAKRITAFIRELGLENQDLVLRSDQEPALQDLLGEVGKKRAPARTFYEVSLVGSSASNGVAERGVQTVEGQIRVLKDALEMRLEVQIPSNHNILSWLVEFAGTVVNRYEVGRDGKTPYERLRGKQSRLTGFEFGEKVNFRRTAVGARMAKLDSLWSDGVFLGYRSISGEIVVGTKNGVFKTRTVQRKAYEHRWGKENLDMVGGVPWKSTPDGDEEEAIMPAIDIGMEMPEVVAKDFKPRSKINDKEGLFAATPPLELVKILLMKVARGHKAGNANIRKVMFLDISKAHLYAPMLDEEFVEFPPKRRKEGKCARLIYTLYGHAFWSKQLGKGIQQDIGGSWIPSWTSDSCSFLSSDTRHQDHRAW